MPRQTFHGNSLPFEAKRLLINHIAVDTLKKVKMAPLKCSAFARWFSGGVEYWFQSKTVQRPVFHPKVGCSLTVRSALPGFEAVIRNLNPDEIYDQAMAIHRKVYYTTTDPLQHCVYGEWENPMNYKTCWNPWENYQWWRSGDVAQTHHAFYFWGAKMIKSWLTTKVQIGGFFAFRHSANRGTNYAFCQLHLNRFCGNLEYWHAKTKVGQPTNMWCGKEPRCISWYGSLGKVFANTFHAKWIWLIQSHRWWRPSSKLQTEVIHQYIEQLEV